MKKYLCFIVGVGGVAHIGNVCLVEALNGPEARSRARGIFKTYSEDDISVLLINDLKDGWSFFVMI